MRKIEILLFILIFLWTGFLFKNKIIYSFFKEIFSKYSEISTNDQTDTQSNINLSEDIEDLIYIPKVKDFKKIFLKKIVNDRYIEIIIPENVLKFYMLDNRTKEFILKKTYPVSVGKPSTPSEIGEGIIYTKGKILFKYKYGKNRGQIVKYSRMPDGTKIRIPYEKMRGLYMLINNSVKYVIHSTTEYWRIGAAVSGGCIRMLIGDMLEFYPYVKPVMKVKIVYKLFQLDDDLLTVYRDIYHRSFNMYKDLINFFKSRGINPLIFDQKKLKNLLYQPLPTTVSLNELLHNYFISRNLTWDKIKIENMKKEKEIISIVDKLKINE